MTQSTFCLLHPWNFINHSPRHPAVLILVPLSLQSLTHGIGLPSFLLQHSWVSFTMPSMIFGNPIPPRHLMTLPGACSLFPFPQLMLSGTYYLTRTIITLRCISFLRSIRTPMHGGPHFSAATLFPSLATSPVRDECLNFKQITVYPPLLALHSPLPFRTMTYFAASPTHGSPDTFSSATFFSEL